MGGHTFPEVPCVVCNRPLALEIDLSVDEDGNPIHAECYAHRLATARSNETPAEKLLDTLATQPLPLCCPECGSPFSHLDATFVLQSGKSCTIPLPVCSCRASHEGTALHTDA